MHTVTVLKGNECRQACAVAEMTSVRAWVNLHVGPDFAAPMVCLYQGRPLLRDEWEITIICADVVFVPLPLGNGGGGGKNPMAIIGMVIVMAVAVIAQQYWALPATATAWGISATTASVIGYLSAAAIMISGSLLVNSLFPTKMKPLGSFNTQELESASPTYSLTASGNQARLYQMIPESFGTNDQSPDLAAQSYAEFQNNEQYLYQLLCVGIGEYHVHSISIEDTAIWKDGAYTGNFPEVEIEIVNPGQRITLFPDNIESSPEVIGQALNKESIGPVTANSAGTQTTALAVDVIFPRGLGRMNDQPGGARILSHGLSLRFEYRFMDDAGTPQGDWQTLVAPYYSAATQTAQRHTHIVAVPPGRYQVRAWCTGGGQEDSLLLNEVVWAGLKAYLPSKLVYPDITLIAVRARATNALSQQSARQIRVVHTRKLPVWRPNLGWSEPVPTNSWAWAMAAIAKAPWGGRRTDRQIDLNALYRLDQTLAARGDEFCQVLDTRQTVWSLFGEACRCVRTVPRAVFSTISWMRDEPGLPVRGMFTPYNIIRGSFSVDYAFFSDDSPDDVIVEYRDRDNWMEREVHALLPDSLSMEPARKRFLGVTLRQQAYNEGYFEAACNGYRRIFPKWSTEMEGLLLFRGDRVLLTHPLNGEGHFAAVTGWNEAEKSLSLDTALPWDEDGGWYAVLRRPNGAPYGPVKVSGVEGKTLVFDAAGLDEVEGSEREKADGDDEKTYRPLWQWLSSGAGSEATAVAYGREAPGAVAIILSVKPRQNGICDIEAVLEDERVHVDPGEASPWEPGGEKPVAAMRPVITGLTASLDLVGDSATLSLSWNPESGAWSYQIQHRSWNTWEEWVPAGKDTPEPTGPHRPVYQYSPDGDRVLTGWWVERQGWSEWNDAGETTEPSLSFAVPPRLVEYRVRGLAPEIDGLWTTRQADCSVPMPKAPALSLAAPYLGGNLSLVWDAVTAESISIVVRADGSDRLTRAVDGSAVSFAATADDFRAVGGPWRTLEVHAVAKRATWEVKSLSLDVVNPPPAKVTGLTVHADGDQAVIGWDAVVGDVTGYIVGHSDPLGEGAIHIVEGADVTSLELSLSVGRHTFIVAAKDALYDARADIYELSYSDPVYIEVTA